MCGAERSRVLLRGIPHVKRYWNLPGSAVHSSPTTVPLPSGGLEGPHLQLRGHILQPPSGGSPSALPAASPRSPSLTLPPPHPGAHSGLAPTPEPGQWLSSLPVTSLALPPGSVIPHPSIINPVSPVPGISLALSGCTGSEWGTSCSPRRAQDRHRSGPPRGLLELPAPGLTLDPGSGQL